MWRQLLPPDMFEEDNVLLMGIGSIFNAEQAPLSRTQGKRIFVLGTGAGYGPLPPNWQNWSLLAVRGPLTARLVGRPTLAATDAAALIAVLPSFVAAAPERKLVLFVPHHHSMNHGKWEDVAQGAGLTFVDPRWELSKVMNYFSRAKLVVTEAMHGAIIADTLRIPWVPVNTSPDVLPFKWRDWTLSLDVPYKPKALPASCFWERHHHRFLSRRATAQGVIASGLLKEVDSPAFLVEDFRDRYREKRNSRNDVCDYPAVPENTVRHGKSHPSRWRKLAHALAQTLDPLLVENAAHKLAKVVQSESYLSDDSIFADRLDRLQRATHDLIKAVRG